MARRGRLRSLTDWADAKGASADALQNEFVDAFVSAAELDPSRGHEVRGLFDVRVSADEVFVEFWPSGAELTYHWDGTAPQLIRALRFSGWELGTAFRTSSTPLESGQHRRRSRTQLVVELSAAVGVLLGLLIVVPFQHPTIIDYPPAYLIAACVGAAVGASAGALIAFRGRTRWLAAGVLAWAALVYVAVVRTLVPEQTECNPPIGVLLDVALWSVAFLAPVTLVAAIASGVGLRRDWLSVLVFGVAAIVCVIDVGVAVDALTIAGQHCD